MGVSRNADRPRRVLIVRPSALGDVCRTVPALVTLKRALPEAQIDWLVHEDFVDAVRHHPDLAEVVPFARKALGQALKTGRAAGSAWRWLEQLRAARYDMAVDLQGLARSGLITRLSAAPVRLGYANARELAWMGYNRRIPVDRALHSVDRMLGLLEGAGYAVHRDMRLYVGPEDRSWLEHWRAEHVPDGRYACLAPTARWPCKCWPLENYVEVARRLQSSNLAGERIVVLASPSERSDVEAAFAELKTAGHDILLPRTTVGQLMALLSETQLLVCNDSAPLHIAVAFERPIVTVFGPTDPALVGPYGRPETVVRPPPADNGRPVRYRAQRDDQSFIDQVSVEAVWQKVREQVEGA